MNPILLKDGIPITFSFASFILPIITTRKRIHSKSSSLSQTEDETSLKHLVISFQDRELEIERRFVRYCGLKEQELKFSQLQNLLELELAHVEFYKLMVEFVEADNKRFGDMVVEYLKIGGKLETANTKNCLLEMKVKKLLSASRKYVHASSKKALMLRSKEDEISRNQENHEQEDKHDPLKLNFKQKYEENDHNPGYDSDNYSTDTTNDESHTHITTDMNYQRKTKLLKKLKR
ncbi:hypothetical protein MKX03_007234 [Papaver bracteatum]|nr:hypothetical protein MKX03_007234 [Papaver bracteatum]